MSSWSQWTYLGIDPGVSGGVAMVREGFADAWKMPSAPRELADLLRDQEIASYVCVLEKVGPARGRDGRRQGVTSAFSFGENFGMIQGVLEALGVKYDFVATNTWQREFDLTGSDKDDADTENKRLTQKKNRHKAAAQRLFPELKVTHQIADALLLAEWCRRHRRVD